MAADQARGRTVGAKTETVEAAEGNASVMAKKIVTLVQEQRGMYWTEVGQKAMTTAITAYLWGRHFVPRSDFAAAQGELGDAHECIVELEAVLRAEIAKCPQCEGAGDYRASWLVDQDEYAHEQRDCDKCAHLRNVLENTDFHYFTTANAEIVRLKGLLRRRMDICNIGGCKQRPSKCTWCREDTAALEGGRK